MTNPPIPSGYKLMPQIAVTPAMTAWAVKILRDPQKYPIFATTTQAFNGLTVLARVEWHAPDFQNHAVHRGVTLHIAAQPSPDLALVEGVDLSGYQPVVDFNKAAASGVAFTFIKATEGTTLVDRSFGQHWRDAKQAGLLRGAYHFFRPKQDAVVQAKFFLTQLSDPGELPPVLDVEVTDGIAGAQLAVGIGSWLDVVASALGRPLIYTSPAFWNSLPATAELARKADLWVAHWGARRPGTVNGWQRWTFWQFTNKAMAGIPGTAGVDENRFNGSLTELRAYSARFEATRPGKGGGCDAALA